MRRIGHRTAALVIAGLAAGLAAGCATRADVLSLDRAVRDQLTEQRRQIQTLQREVERLRADVEEGGGSGRGRPDDRVAQLEARIATLERGAGLPPPLLPGEEELPPEELPPAAPPTTLPPPPPPPAATAGDETFQRDVRQALADAGASNAAEAPEFVAALSPAAAGQCPRAVPALNGFAAKHKDASKSKLADDALYWAARCHAARRDQNQAISKFYEVVTRYPEGDKAPAALWAQANLFIDMGNTPDARIVLGKLVREYPNSEEAARARQKVHELNN